ncbi:unnamed protein product [Heligmosomoides polygyrus]|uniref:Oxidored_molyb domain-containing protein n=1 Tax=Heligmosomoides polygyrus TaxID=6339 RepID=A0A3P7ZII6_HELPZ|nr:unnamed protein product [Heligmosomoides polygyrus]
MYTLLSKITTWIMRIEFHSRGEARRLLRTISVRPPSQMMLKEQSTGPDKRVLSPFIKPLKELRDGERVVAVKWIVYSADMEMVDNDMLEAIDTEAAIVQLTGTERSRDELWLANIIERYSAVKPHQVRCVRCNATEYLVERNESMNADIIYTFCPYLDLGSLFALAAAYPIWSPIIRSHMEKKKLDITLLVVSEG